MSPISAVRAKYIWHLNKVHYYYYHYYRISAVRAKPEDVGSIYAQVEDLRLCLEESPISWIGLTLERESGFRGFSLAL